MNSRSRRRLVFIPVVLIALHASCSRRQYRESADGEVYGILAGETTGTPWEVPDGFTIAPGEESRLYDPSDPDFPELPSTRPELYSYELPELEHAARRSGPPSTGPDPADPASSETSESGIAVQPVPKSYWDALPRDCLARMLEFDSVRDEYTMQYDAEPPPELRDNAQKLAILGIFEQALLNSREYLAQKESLYRSALSLTLQRFEFFPKFNRSGNGADATYAVNRNGGATTESANISSGFGFEALLITGGRLLASFTNDVVFTFDGADGFSRHISSEVLVNLSQSVLQRDVRLNPLVQAERELVYASRDFARFRKEFFLDVASQYYSILQSYRSIEIESQNYFSLVRTFEQARAELRAGVRNAPNPVSVDQFEQGMLSGRSSLITACNRLERGLDNLKLVLGLPTETQLNIDLAELDELTLRDSVEVAAERVRRWLQRVADRRARNDRAEIVNATIFLAERLFELIELRRRLVPDQSMDTGALELLLERLRLERARIDAERSSNALEATESGGSAPTFLVAQHMDDVVEALGVLARAQLSLLTELDPTRADLEALRNRIEGYFERLETIREQLEENAENVDDAVVERVLAELTALRGEIAGENATLDAALAATDAAPRPQNDDEKMQQTLEQSDQVAATARDLLARYALGLPPVDIAVDDAMLTALTQRLDLMNERGRLADDRRNVKLTADELRSVLDLSVSHSIRTPDNKPFKFTSDESRTSVGVGIDLPLNRRSQRNNYRGALLNYQTGRRSLLALEDRIKFDVRNGLRDLDETRLQYPISVTRAALAAEQVISVRLQLALGVEGVRGTDLLDALQSSRESLIAVANNRIGYITDRARFVLDLEAMELDALGFWPAIDDTEYRPAPNLVYPENAGPAYGEIPRYLLVSSEFRAAGGAEDPRDEITSAAAAGDDDASDDGASTTTERADGAAE